MVPRDIESHQYEDLFTTYLLQTPVVGLTGGKEKKTPGILVYWPTLHLEIGLVLQVVAGFVSANLKTSASPRVVGLLR